MTGKTGLIVIDLQHAFNPCETVVRHIADALPDYDYLVALRHINTPGSLFESELDFTRCYEGAADAELVIPLPGAVIFDHNSYGILPGQIETLRQFDVKRWDIGGVDTHGCVLATCFNLFDHHIRFRVLKSLCHSSKGENIQQASFDIMALCFGQNSLGRE